MAESLQEKPMEPLLYQLLPELEETGSYRELKGVLPLEVLKKGYQLFNLTGGIPYDIRMTNTGDGVLLRGFAYATGITECARCLEDAPFDVQGAVEGYFIINPNEIEQEESDEEFTAVPDDGLVDLETPIIAAIIFELPQVLFCKEDCAGLCATCGANLNIESCDCAKAPDPDSPFAVLKDLL